MPLSLPEEVLLSVATYLVDNTIPVPRQTRDTNYTPPFHYVKASPELLTLSLATRQFRRICLPLVFSYIECCSKQEFEKFTDACRPDGAPFLRCTR